MWLVGKMTKSAKDMARGHHPRRGRFREILDIGGFGLPSSPSKPPAPSCLGSSLDSLGSGLSVISLSLHIFGFLFCFARTPLAITNYQ